MTNKKDDNNVKTAYMQVNKGLFGNGFKPIEILILSQIDEYVRNTGECYVTDEQFALYFGVTSRTVSNTLNSLEEKGYIKRNTELCSNNGQASRKRTITLTRDLTSKVGAHAWYTK